MFRPIRFSLIAALLIAATSTNAQLNGSYTVGTFGNYANVAAAITALQTNGVSGPVTMNILSGSYTGTWTIGVIAGTSAVNTVTFQSQTMSAAAVTLTGLGISTTFTLNGCAFVRLRHLTINSAGSCIILDNTASDITVQQCVISAGTTYSGVGAGISFTGARAQVLNNTILAGGIGVRLVNTGVSYGINMVVQDNTISGVTNDGIIVERSNGLVITNNTITSAGTNTATYNDGIFVRNGINACSITRNTVNWSIGTTGIQLDSHTLLPGSPPVIENNAIVISAGNAAGTGINVLSSNSTILRHNSVQCNMAKAAVHIQFSTGVVMEGNAMRTTTAECVMTQSGTFTSCDRNCYFSASGNVGRVPPSTYYTMGAWQALGRDASSLFLDPLFVSTTDLHLQAVSPALSMGPLPSLATDRDGASRPQPAGSRPDAGAYEDPNGCTGMSGTFTLGPGVGNDFQSFNHAVLAMSNCSITGPVLFLVQSGAYNEQVAIPQITGTSATNTITFRSQALDSSAVTLTWPSSSVATNDHTIALDGGDRITFDRITIARSGTQSYSRVVVFSGTSGMPGSQFTRFTHCRLFGNSNSLATTAALISTTGAIMDSVRVDGCRLVDGGDGVYWNTGSLGDRLLVEGCTITGQWANGARITITGTFTIRGNTISPAPAGRGIYLGGCNQGYAVHGNRVTATSNALYLANCAGTQPRVYSNFLASLAAASVVVFGSTNQQFDHNSVSGLTYGVHLQAGTNSFASFRNNILSSGNYTLYRQAASSTMALSSNNLLFRTGAGPLAFWTAAQNTLAALQAASGGFANSVNADPRFYNLGGGDLHAYAMEVDMAGTPIASITTDVDGTIRSTTAPDIGADEFQPQLWAEAFNTCGAADAITSTGSGTDRWIYKDRKVVARFNDNGQNLGTVQLSVFLSSGPVRTSDLGQHYLDRNWHLTTQNAITSSASVRLFLSGAEFVAFASADPLVVTGADAGITHYIGVNENCLETDNPAAQTWLSYFPVSQGTEPRVQATGGAYWATATVSDDGELYMSGLGQVLPVELLSFSGERVNEREVMLRWSTATEHNNAGFEVWRMIEGEEEFSNVAWVEGAGESQQLINYQLPDENTASKASYYKLKQVDFDGQFAWSPAVAVAGVSAPGSIVLWPNPAHGTFQVMPAQGGVLRVRLLTMNGSPVRQWDSEAPYDLEGVPAGAYLVRVEHGDGSLEHKRLVVE